MTAVDEVTTEHDRDEEVVVSINGAVEHWLLNRPAARNALSPSLVASLGKASRNAEARRSRVVVLSGAGPGFSAGADLNHLLACAYEGRSPRPLLQSICDLTVAMEQSDIIFIAALHGHAVAGGLELALACDVVLAAEGTVVGDGHVKNNLVPGGGATVRIERRLGAGHAAWLALSGQLVAAESLVASGWIREVVALSGLLGRALKDAQTLATVPAEAQASFKRSLNGPAEPMQSALAGELDSFEEHWNRSDVAAHLREFLGRKEKREND